MSGRNGVERAARDRASRGLDRRQFIKRAPSYRRGLQIWTLSVRRPAPENMSPRAKTHSYPNLILGELEVKARDPDGHAVLLDTNGNLAEGRGSNLFLVRDGALLTPRERFVLPGIRRQTRIELAREHGLAVAEADLDLFDALTAEEGFITSTSYCICPVRQVDGATVGDGRVPGSVTRRLIDAYVAHVGCDGYGQYLRHSNA